METITITKRIINGKIVCNKRFDDYDSGFYGKRISYNEYKESADTNKPIKGMSFTSKALCIVERITYGN